MPDISALLGDLLDQKGPLVMRGPVLPYRRKPMLSLEGQVITLLDRAFLKRKYSQSNNDVKQSNEDAKRPWLTKTLKKVWNFASDDRKAGFSQECLAQALNGDWRRVDTRETSISTFDARGLKLNTTIIKGSKFGNILTDGGTKLYDDNNNLQTSIEIINKQDELGCWYKTLSCAPPISKIEKLYSPTPPKDQTEEVPTI